METKLIQASVQPQAGNYPSSAVADQGGIWKYCQPVVCDIIAVAAKRPGIRPGACGACAGGHRLCGGAGLPAINGLCAAIVPLHHAIFGPSRILVLGPDSSLAAIIAAVIVPLGGGDPARTIALAGMLAIFTGLLCILAGLARLGFITELLSKPIRYGYMNGIALTVLIGQLPKLFGFSTEANGVLPETAAFIQGVLAGKINWVTLALGASTWPSSWSSIATSAFRAYWLR
jgi:hypothetical protein